MKEVITVTVGLAVVVVALPLELLVLVELAPDEVLELALDELAAVEDEDVDD